MKTHHYVQSERCNLKCTYCNVDTLNKHKHTYDDFLGYYNTHIKPNDEHYNFDIFGGEPFMILDEDIILQMVELLEQDDNCKAIRITTNGTYFSELVLQIICKPKVEITISFDGMFQENNRKGYYGRQFDTTVRLISFLKANKRYFKIHSMVVGSMFDIEARLEEQYDFNTMQIFYEEKNNLLINQYNFTQKLLNVKEKDCKIDFEIVRDIGIWKPIQSIRFLTAYKRYIEFLDEKINKNIFKTFDDIDGLYSSYMSALIERSNNKQYTRPTCGVDTGKHTSFFKNEVIPCERFTRHPQALINLGDEEFMSELLSDCYNCNIFHLCNKGCIYEQIVNKQVIVELCDIYKGMFKIVQERFGYLGQQKLKLFYGDTNGK